MRSCVFAGTFDPVTVGHVAAVKRGISLFDRVYVGLLVNPAKQCLFSEEERISFLQQAFSPYPAVEVRAYHGLLVDFMKETGAVAYLRGVRNERDFRYEMENYRLSLALDPSLITLFLPAEKGTEEVSSTRVKELLSKGEDVSALLPEEIAKDVIKAYKAK